MSATRPIRYSEILELDKKIREFESIPNTLSGGASHIFDASMSKSDPRTVEDGIASSKGEADLFSDMKCYNCCVIREIGESMDHII